MSKRVAVVFIFVCLALGLARPAAAEPDVDVELVLLADATGSIDDAEVLFQRQGYAEAIADPAVIAAIRNGAYGRIAVTYVEWGNAVSQEVIVDWTVIDGEESAIAFAEALLEPPRRTAGGNAIGSALLFGKTLLDGNDFNGFRRVIDLSADSAGNLNGPPIEVARDKVVAGGITINGLAVLCRYCSGRPISYDLEEAFTRRVIGGPNAFVVTADSAATFSDAVRRKLLLEVAGRDTTVDLAGRGHAPPLGIQR